MTFEDRLANAFDRYVAPAPVAVNAPAVAASAASATRNLPTNWRPRAFVTPVRPGMRLALLLLAAFAIAAAAIAAGSWPKLPAPLLAPLLAPVNGQIVISVGSGATYQFHLIYPDGNGFPSTLPITGGADSCPTFSPDGQTLAYIGYRPDTGSQDLFIARADGTASRKVWEGSFNTTTFHQIVWSADSRVVAATKGTLPAPGPDRVIVMGHRDSGTSTLLEWSTGEFPGEVALSADGLQIAGILPVGAPGDRIVVRTLADGTERIIPTSGRIHSIAWSPDGRAIAYVAGSSDQPDNTDVYLVRADGSDLRALDPGSAGSERQPAWSPDGRMLAVTNDAGYTQLFDSTGAKVRRLEGSAGLMTWAPDSRALLFAVYESLSNRKALRVDIETGDTRAVNGASGFYAPCPVSWRPVPAVSTSPDQTAPVAPTAMQPTSTTSDRAWTEVGSLALGRRGHTATVLGDGSVLVVGGETTLGGDRTSATELYEPSARIWATRAPTKVAHSRHTATRLRDGTVLIGGGNDTDSAEIYDPAAGTWAATGAMSAVRADHTATLLEDGTVLVAGGRSTGSSAEIYVTATRSWHATGQMVDPRWGHTATLLSDGRVLVVGGSSTSGDGFRELASAEVYDPGTGTWSAAAVPPMSFVGHTATLLQDGTVLVTGGWHTNNGHIEAWVVLYDPTRERWATLADLPDARGGHTATLLDDGTVLVVGGVGNAEKTCGDVLASVALFDPVGQSWSAAEPLSGPRYDHVATPLLDGGVLVTGGTDTVCMKDPLASVERFR